MIAFVVRRLLWTIPVLFVATFLTFSLVKAMPYEPFESNRRLNPTVRENLRELYGLDEPFLVQYGTFVGDLVQGDFGVSTKPGAREVRDVIASKLPTSMLLGVLAFTVGAVLGTLAGVVSALRANGVPDYLITIVTTAAFALPSFVVARLWVVHGYWQPVGRFYGWDTWVERMGPILVLGLSIMPYFTRLVRASMLESLQKDYVTTARAKGLPWRRTVTRHVLRNSLIPMVVNAGPLFGFVLTGSFVIEHIMDVPGIADAFIDALGEPIDSRMVLATTVVLSTIIIVMNLVVDVVMRWLDPRIADG